MEIATEILNAIEARAERAIAQEIPLMVKKILRLRPALSTDAQEQADALLLKLYRLKSELVFVTDDETTPEQQFLREARAA